MTFTKAGTKSVIIDQTAVKDDFEVTDMGKKLVLDSVHFVREREIIITPICPFANRSLKKSRISDVL